MKIWSALAAYFAKVAAVAFASLVVLAVLIGMAFAFYSRATGARVSDGAFLLRGEDFLWIGLVAVVIGAAAAAAKLVRG